MAANELLRLVIEADTKGAVQSVEALGKSADRSLGKTQSGLDKTAKRMQKFGAGAVATGAVFGYALFGMAKQAEESAKITAQTNAVLESTGAVANVSAGEVSKLADSLSKKSGVDDELIQSGENMLLTFTNVRNEVGKGNDIFNQATALALDYSVATGTDVVAANKLMGKALNDPLKGLSALTKAGVTFTDQQKAMIKQMVASGDTVGAQKVILAEFSKEFKGSAEAQATDSAKAQVAFENMQEAIGAGVLPVLNKLVTGLSAITDAFSSLPSGVQSGIGTFGAFAVGALVVGGTITTVVGKVIEMRDLFKGLAGPVSKAKDAVANLVSSMGTAGLLGAAAGVGAVIAAGTILYQGYIENKRKATEQTNELTRALQEEASGQKGATDAAIAGQFANEEFGQTMLDAGYNAQTFVDLVKDMPKGLSKLSGEYRQLALDNGGWNQALELTDLKGTQVGDMLDELRDSMSAGEFQRFLEWLHESANNYDAATGKAKAHAKANEDVKSATEKTKEATEEQNKYLQDQVNAFDAALSAAQNYHDGMTAMLDTQLAFEQALDDGTKTIKENGNTLDINTQKGRDNIKATKAGADAVIKLGIERKKETGSNKQASVVIAQHTQRLNDEWRAAGLTEDQIAFLNRQYGLTPSQVNTTLSANPNDALADAAAVASAMARLKNQFGVVNLQINAGVNSVLGALSGSRAAGGPVSKDKAYLVGEMGPEVFVANQDGYIVPNGGGAPPMPTMGMGTASGDTININLYGTTVTPESVVKALNEHYRRNGKRLVNV